MFGKCGNALAEGQQVVIPETFRGDLENLLAAHVGHVFQLGNAGDQLVYWHFGGLIGGAVGDIGTGSGDRAACCKNDDVRFVLGYRRAAEDHGRDHE